MKRYNPKEIEPKWQKQWAESKIYEANEHSNKPKKYVLEFFPYPSGAAMHVGHVRNYTIGDVIARFARMRGYNVMHPMGWDAFGLPAENFAIKTGISPQKAIEQNTSRFKKQLEQMGFGYDWSREINSSDPEYYRWTQWFFLLLLKKGLAYQQESLQWWCPVDKTVLANEQVEAGKCWRCGSDVEKKALKQWFFKITDYADRLIKDLDDVNWTDSIKSMQRNWIGRSRGAEIDFAIEGHSKNVTVFTTRPDTICGVTFMVLAPEHPLVKTITTPEQREIVGNYVQATQAKSDVERQETNREKSGAFTGAYAVNPINGEKIPIWIADYVLFGYGTGAIMAVPAHDDRDNDFAKKFEITIKPVITPSFADSSFGGAKGEITDRPVAVAVAHDPVADKYCIMEWKKDYRQGLEFPGGGIDKGESIKEGVIREFTEETGYTDFEVEKVLPVAVSFYYSGRYGVKRAVKNIVKIRMNSLKNNGIIGTENYEKNGYKVYWLSKDEILAKVTRINLAIAEFAFGETIHAGEGVLINSGKYDRLTTEQAREKIVADLAKKKAGKERVNYKIRDWLISRQRYWGAPIPVIHCKDCGAQPVPQAQLPVMLPEMKSYEPSNDGRSPLARVEDFVNVKCPKCNGPAQRETDTMDGFACSSWYFLRYADPHNAKKPFNKAQADKWLPVDNYIGGVEHAVMHLLYARFWTKIMQDEGLINFSEPFTSLHNHGMILAPDNQKMSKSKGNTIEPDSLIEQGYGVDSIRIMELFIGPWNQSAAWSVEGMGGSFRFLQRVWGLAQAFQERGKDQSPAEDIELKRITHKTIHKISKDIDEMGFNTAVAAMMEMVNHLYKLRATIPFEQAPQTWQWTLNTLVQLLAPFAPHITEELWSQLGNEDSVHTSNWPVHDEKFLVSDTVKIVVQVNGKLRAEIEVPAEASKDDILHVAQTNERAKEYLADHKILKTIYVPNRLVNFVV